MLDAWKTNYKSMSVEQISAEYNRLISVRGPKKNTDFSDRLKFLKDEYAIKVRK